MLTNFPPVSHLRSGSDVRVWKIKNKKKNKRKEKKRRYSSVRKENRIERQGQKEKIIDFELIWCY